MARRRGTAGWKWGAPVFLLMLGLIFWDWLPMELSYRHLCDTEAGFTEYKSLDQWKRENPGVAETLAPIEKPVWKREGHLTRVALNQRFAWDTVTSRHWFHIVQRDERIVDTRTGETLAQYTDFVTDIPPIGIGADSLGDYKFWMRKRSCETGRSMPQQMMFNDFLDSVEKLGKQ